MNSADFWKKVKSDLEVQLSPMYFNTWIKPTKAEMVNETTLKIICRDALAKKNIQKRLLSMIADAVFRIEKKRFDLVFEVGEVTPLAKPKNKNAGALFENAIRTQTQVPKNTGLQTRYTFENYIMGTNNQVAYAVALKISEDPGKEYNPFFIYGGVGLGKTHLMQAIGNRLLNKKPELKILCTTGESFTNELIEGIQSGRGKGTYTSNKFREKYRKADLLLIDDIQFIAGKEATQQEFFHTFNALYTAQKQIVITSDKPPSEFTNIEARITSRFSSGMIADIQAPDMEVRSAILRAKRDENGDTISNEVIDTIAERVDTNVRELEGAYLQIVTLAKTTGQDITEQLAGAALGATIKEKIQRPVNLNQILKAVCNYYSVAMADVKGKRRTKEFVVPRQMAMFLMHDLTGTPYLSIGEYLGGRDHTTIMHGVRKIETEVRAAAKSKQDAANIKQTIYAE